MLHVLPTQGKLIWSTSRVWRDSRVILSNQKSVSRQLANFVVTRQVWTWVVKHVTPLFNTFCRNVAKHVPCFCCPSYSSFKGAVSGQSSWFCLILPLTRPQSLWNLKEAKKLHVNDSQTQDKQMCLLSIIFEVASSRDQLWKTVRLNSFQKS